MSDQEAKDKQRADVLKGAKALGNGTVEVIGETVLAVISAGASSDLRKAATKAGKRAFAMNAAELVEAIEGKAKPVETPGETGNKNGNK